MPSEGRKETNLELSELHLPGMMVQVSSWPERRSRNISNMHELGNILPKLRLKRQEIKQSTMAGRELVPQEVIGESPSMVPDSRSLQLSKRRIYQLISTAETIADQILSPRQVPSSPTLRNLAMSASIPTLRRSMAFSCGKLLLFIFDSHRSQYLSRARLRYTGQDRYPLCYTHFSRGPRHRCIRIYSSLPSSNTISQWVQIRNGRTSHTTNFSGVVRPLEQHSTEIRTGGVLKEAV